MCYHNFIFIKCATKIHIFRFICNHGKYYCIGNSWCVIIYQQSKFGKHARCSDNDFRFAVNSRYREIQSTFDTESFSQILTV